ncbi:hypothetical protein MTO96_038815 [Rhipicephalus appendiculatus]
MLLELTQLFNFVQAQLRPFDRAKTLHPTTYPREHFQYRIYTWRDKQPPAQKTCASYRRIRTRKKRKSRSWPRWEYFNYFFRSFH